jgi:7,8-dihydropterin-6-yl-methyl-4-(beta-D-ribofuranosyl)aminobenzene 5'-phosphate synthase
MSLSAEERYFGGAPPEVMRFGAAWPNAHIQLVDKNTEIAPGIHLITLISDKPGTLELRELSLVINTPAGEVVVVGCSHPGIEKILESVSGINPHIHLIAGGFHLVTVSDTEIEKVVAALHDKFRVDEIAPGHCTGEPAFAALRRAFGERYLYAGLGTTLSFTDIGVR